MFVWFCLCLFFISIHLYTSAQTATKHCFTFKKKRTVYYGSDIEFSIDLAQAESSTIYTLLCTVGSR